ncbi:hypothetical protein FHL15_000116 [Xylaria flabelliformis]|uniref:Uncharacterized protein n=1 Tax=Xylaria flabelliformis TaxID=2512241 RepID=A0A553IF07_9PEZI|nr:hypothetical protein FHL15_000116 [Xylaria flabelliformis]
MMPIYFNRQDPGSIPPGPLHGQVQGHAYQHSLSTAVTPSKRSVEDDDDIQFISEKPVKRRRVSEKQPALPVPQQPVVPLAITPHAVATAAACDIVPNHSLTVTQMPSSDPKDAERRLSTGMVGLPSDIQTMELAYALRGVSMPVLESFVLNQPFRKPRPSSPPELSPKQMPSTISPGVLDIQSGQRATEAFKSVKRPSNSVSCQSSRHTTPFQVEKSPIASEPVNTAFDTYQTHMLSVPSNPDGNNTPTEHANRANSKSTSMPPPPPPSTLPCPEVSRDVTLGSSLGLLENHHHHNSSAQPQKQSCLVCSRLKYQAQLTRAQGFPMVNAALPHHFMPQFHYHTPYGQHIHPQMLTMSTGNVHQYGTNSAPVMIPVNGDPLAPLSSHPPSQAQSQQPTTQQQKGAEQDGQTTSEQYRKTESPQISHPKNDAADTRAASSPIKPPASLIQPTYRKPSPNLIVDVAETCQEKFPFQEVADRHKVPVEKVFDVFAAIIQVPLLRCPTDRRRAGRLATARIKEYSKAKKDIMDPRTEKGEVNGLEAVVDSTNIAQRLGQVEFPDGFNLGGK